MELLVLLHEKDIQISRFRLPLLLQKASKNLRWTLVNSWGADKRTKQNGN